MSKDIKHVVIRYYKALAHSRIIEIIAVLLAVFSLIRLFLLSIFPKSGIDFFGIWTAGYMWNHHMDPYGAHFSSVGRALVGKAMAPVFWLYPPQWWPIAILLSKFTPRSALLIWQISNFILLLASLILLNKSLNASSKRQNEKARWQFPLIVFAICTMQATAFNIYAGQNSFIVIFSMSLMLYGISNRKTAITAFGLAICLLKPQIGVPISLVFAIFPQDRPVFVGAIILSTVACLPLIIGYDLASFISTAQSFIANISSYASHPFNSPETRIGISQIANLMSTSIPNVPVLLIVTILAILIASLLNKMRGANHIGVIDLVLGIAIVTVFMPLHDYDLVFMGIPLFLINRMPIWLSMLLILSFFLVSRAASISILIFHQHSMLVQSSVITIGVISITLCVGWYNFISADKYQRIPEMHE